MKAQRWTLVTVLLFSLVGPAWADDIRPAMEAINAKFLAAFNTPNAAAFPALYTDDAILIFPGGALGGAVEKRLAPFERRLVI